MQKVATFHCKECNREIEYYVLVATWSYECECGAEYVGDMYHIWMAIAGHIDERGIDEQA